MGHYYNLGWHRKADDFQEVWHRSKGAHYGEPDVEVTIKEVHELTAMDQLFVETVPIKAVLSDENEVYVPNKYAVVATAPWLNGPQFLRTVGPRYQATQIGELAASLEGLQKHWPLAGTMVLKDGQIQIVQLKIDDFYVGNHDGERHLSFLTVANDHSQNGHIWLRTNIRAQCFNTYSLSLNALDKIRIPHNENADIMLAFMAKVEEATIESQKQHVQDLNRLFTRKITKDEVATVLEEAFPSPGKTSKMKIAESDAAQKVGGKLGEDFFALVEQDKATVDWKQDRAMTLRTEAAQRYMKFNDFHPYAAETAYALFQGVTEMVNHSELFTGAPEKNQVALLLGQKKDMQARAWNALVDLS